MGKGTKMDNISKTLQFMSYLRLSSIEEEDSFEREL
jgi:hypothetical protein